MGAGLSSGTVGTEIGGGESTGLGDIPESCVAAVLLHLEPTEICRVARLNRAFRSAACADCVWEAKLPQNYQYLMSLVGSTAAEEDRAERAKVGKKEIYAQFCRPNPFDGGTKVFWIDKGSGLICMSISSNAMIITGIDDRRYWNRISTEESRFHSFAYLHQMWWLEIVGEIDFCFPAGTYSLFFRIYLGRPSKRLGRRFCNSEHIHGWDLKPVRFQLWTTDGKRTQHVATEYYLGEPGTWILYHVGDFDVSNSNASTRLKFSMTQIDCTHTKGGLCVDSAMIYPMGFRHEKEKQLYSFQATQS